ncbi:MAG TPA: hypothetical protein VNA13_01290 [Xanthomonadales bacterium]|nr:hypothetical protein [Xanthomonadales bacterium]
MAYSKPSTNPHEQAILTSIIYSDIFNFPLTKSELWKFLISEKKISRISFEKTLKKLSTTNRHSGKRETSASRIPNDRSQSDPGQARMTNKISHKDTYYCLAGQEKIIDGRRKNKAEAVRKLKIAQKATLYLSHIPSILFIGISGGLAMGDVEPTDDIDIFVITKKNTIFKSRLLILFLLQLLNLRRRRNDANPTDKICVNYLIDEESLSFSKKKHDVYTAHEILQIKPLYDVKSTFGSFLESNKWINSFFPNAKKTEGKNIQINKIFTLKLSLHILNIIIPEKLGRFVQMIFINKHRKSEIVTNHVLAFHPNDYRVQTLDKLRLKLHELGLLTN